MYFLPALAYIAVVLATASCDPIDEGVVEPKDPALLIEVLNLPPSPPGLIIEERTLNLGMLPDRPKSVQNYPFNPSIIKLPSGDYLMTFRVDTAGTSYNDIRRASRIALTELDADFKEKDSKNRYFLDTSSSASEDARIFLDNENIYIVYNDLPAIKFDENALGGVRKMHLATVKKISGKWAVDRRSIVYLHDGLNSPTRTEKNWSPFVDGNSLNFSYSFNPHRVLTQTSALGEVIETSQCPAKRGIWEWGELRGGTPSIRREQNYLGFFHSLYEGKFYLMGAYTFEGKAPYCLNSISKSPIWNEKLYDIERRSALAPPQFTVIFPGGFVESQYNGKQVFVVAAGVEDSAIKLIFLDKQILLNSLVPV